MIDPDLKYCPKCHDEYRAEIARCAACEIPLLDGADMLSLEQKRQEKMAARKGEITPEDQVVVIERGSLQDLRRLDELMAAERIGTRMVGEDGACGKGCCPSTFYLQVRQEDAADALRILAAEHQRTTALDDHHDDYGEAVFNPDAAEATCPACGCSFSTATSDCPDCGLCFG